MQILRAAALCAACLVAACSSDDTTVVVVPDGGTARVDAGAQRMDVPGRWDVPPLDVPAPDVVAKDVVEAGADVTDVPTRAQYCEGTGPALQVGPPGASRCAGRLAETVFRYAICTCSDLALAGYLRTDSYDSSRGGPTGERGGAVGVDGNYTIVGYSNLGDNLTIAGGAPLSLVGVHTLREDLYLGGSLTVIGTLDVNRDAHVHGNVTALGPFHVHRDFQQQNGSFLLGSITVDGARSDGMVSYPPPCPCGPTEVFDIAGAIDDARANNDNVAGLFDPTHFDAVVGQQITVMPCGRYFANRVAGLGDIELHVDGRTALFIDGDFDLGGFFNVVLGAQGELDVFIRGNVLGAGYLRMGGSSRPSGVRIYIAGANGFTLLGASQFVGNVYAPRAPVTIAGYMNLHGAIFAHDLHTGGDLDVHYDRTIVHAGDECPPDPTPATCAHCGSCRSSQACVAGACGRCRTDADCCDPLVCTAAGVCDSVPP